MPPLIWRFSFAPEMWYCPIQQKGRCTLIQKTQQRDKYPSVHFLYLDSKIHIWISHPNGRVSIPHSHQVRYRRHGTFTFSRFEASGRAVVQILIPRKGWNTASRTETITLDYCTKYTFNRGAITKRRLEKTEWQWIEHALRFGNNTMRRSRKWSGTPVVRRVAA